MFGGYSRLLRLWAGGVTHERSSVGGESLVVDCSKKRFLTRSMAEPKILNNPDDYRSTCGTRYRQAGNIPLSYRVLESLC